MSQKRKIEFDGELIDMTLGIPKKRLHQYLRQVQKKTKKQTKTIQESDLEFTIHARGGEVKFSRFMAEYSGYFANVSQNRESFKKATEIRKLQKHDL